jgi:RNA polymerase sigma factor (sigma-70 family)
MATGQLSAVLQHLQRMAGVCTARELSDAELLERFVAHHEEAAFAALVQRYGPMVLGVCRRVLQNAHDAEDAFQATFLILVRKAASIGKREALGCWLHGVALRIAVRAKVNEAGRRLRERQVQAMPQTDAIATVAWRELKPILDEEVARLPDRYRVPFVLCYLEGKTYARAARQLCCVTGTISKRLARARELLRRRLVRRGLALPAGVLAAVLSQNGTSAAMPASLAAATIKTALQTAAGTAAAGAVSPRVASLTEGGLKTMGATTWKLTLALLLALGVLGAGAGLLVRRAPAEASAADQPKTSAQGKAAPAKERPKARVGDPAKPEADKQMSVTGRVVDAGDKPLAGASVAVIGRAVSAYRIAHRSMWPKALGQGKSDTDGRFRLTVPRTSKEGYWDVNVLAGLAGHGLGQVRFDPDTKQPDVKIVLPKEQMLRGRLVDLQGRAAAGVQVHVVHLNGGTSKKEYIWVQFKEPPEGLTPWPASAATDGHGRFVLRGLGPNWTVTVQTRGERFARQEFAIKPEDRQGGKEITLALAPARILEGTVTYADTRKPVANARLLVSSEAERYAHTSKEMEGRTDARGRFRVAPYAGNFFTVIAYPPEGEPYLLLQKRFNWPQADVVKHEVNLALVRGVQVHGTVTEKPSGKPVAGTSVRFEPSMDNNPYYRRDLVPLMRDWGEIAVSDAAGKFQLTVLPGPGSLLVKAPTVDYLHVEVSNKKIYGQGIQPDWRNYLDAFVELNLKPQPGPHDVGVVLRRGVTLSGKLVGPDGKPVPQAALVCRSYIPYGFSLNGVQARPVKGGRFEVPGCDPDRPTQVFFYAAKEKLGAMVELAPKEALRQPPTVRLQPCGSATVRLVDKDGKPAVNTRATVEFFLTPGIPFVDSLKGKGPVADTCYMQNLDPERHRDARPDAQGRVTFPTLIPGATYLTIGQGPDRGIFNLNKQFKAEAGKALDLGTITVPARN